MEQKEKGKEEESEQGYSEKKEVPNEPLTLEEESKQSDPEKEEVPNERLIFKEDISDMDLENFLIKFIPPAWSLVFNDMTEELIDAGITIQSDMNKSQAILVPHIEDIYSAFVSTPPDNVKVVIIGMDPYLKIHKGIPSATGRCFECRKGMPIEKSLQHVFVVMCKMVKGFTKPKCGDLTKWADQGVLLLNAALTTRSDKSGAHIGAWKFFPEKIIRYLSQTKKNIVYMLWGKDAQCFEEHIAGHRNLILKASHPVARGANNTFLGSVKEGSPPMNHFNEANEYLRQHGRGEIDWVL